MRRCKAPNNEAQNYQVKSFPISSQNNPLPRAPLSPSLAQPFFPSPSLCFLHFTLPFLSPSSAGAAADGMTSPPRRWTAVFGNSMYTYVCVCMHEEASWNPDLLQCKTWRIIIFTGDGLSVYMRQFWMESDCVCVCVCVRGRNETMRGMNGIVERLPRFQNCVCDLIIKRIRIWEHTVLRSLLASNGLL